MESFTFLTTPVIQQNATEAGLAQSVIEQLITLAQRITNEPALRECVGQLFAQTYERAVITIDPTPETLFGAEVNLLYLLLALDSVRRLRASQQQRGIPAAITGEISRSLATAVRRFAEFHAGKAGLEDWVLRYWFGSTAASGDLYRLGRLEFILQPFEGNLRVYRHKQSGQVQVLAEEGVHLTADGYLHFTIGEAAYAHYGWRKTEEAEDGWTATLVEDDTSITGTPISPLGYALRTPLQLAKDEWELRLCNGDTVLDMHIPNFMPLRLDLLHASLQRAMDFFPRYHPDRPFKAFVCDSWLFDTQFVEMLPVSSNILAFQRQGYLFPCLSGGVDGMYFIFGDWLVDLDKAPQDTALRRAIVNHMRLGGKLRSGGFLLLPEDVVKFGQEPYRNDEWMLP
ncbi:MAG: acyltransferase domain-containing protein [Caldilineaceae bacterium]